MIRRWNASTVRLGTVSHGWLVPFVSLYVIWRRRDQLRNSMKQVELKALWLVALALVLHWFGFRGQFPRLSLASLILFSWSAPLVIWGWHTARHLIFPVAYLVFCVPLNFLDTLSFPLRMFATKMTVIVLNGIGIKALRDGTAIYSSAGNGFNFDVADPCSGIRSLLALTALTAVYAVLTQRRLVAKWAVFILAVPVAILANVFRIITIALVAEGFGTQHALNFYHDYSGYLVFVLAVLILMAVSKVVSKYVDK
jgi:exosortase